jgi:hypothetical protein
MEVILSTHKGAPQNRSNTKETKGQSGLALMVEPWAWTNFFIGILSCFLHNQGIVSEIEMAINSFLRRTTEYSGLCGKRIHIIEYPPVRLCTYGVPLSPEWALPINIRLQWSTLAAIQASVRHPKRHQDHDSIRHSGSQAIALGFLWNTGSHWLQGNGGLIQVGCNNADRKWIWRIW